MNKTKIKDVGLSIIMMIIVIVLTVINVSPAYMADGSGKIKEKDLLAKKEIVDSVKYVRKDFTGSSSWIDADKDCQNTRAEVLIEESLDSVKFRKYNVKDTTLSKVARDSIIAKKSRDCVVDSGLWHGPYTGTMFYKANDLDIDHVVALEDAFRSGAWKWTPEKKKEFSNYLKDKGHLIAVSKSENRKKGSKGPEEYLPPNEIFQEEYCRIYVRIKVKFNLTSDKKQLLFLQKMFDGDTSIILPKLRE